MELLEWALATRATYHFKVVCMLCLYMHHNLRTRGQHADALVEFVRGSRDAMGSKKKKGGLSVSLGHQVCIRNFEVTLTMYPFCYTHF